MRAPAGATTEECFAMVAILNAEKYGLDPDAPRDDRRDVVRVIRRGKEMRAADETHPSQDASEIEVDIGD